MSDLPFFHPYNLVLGRHVLWVWIFKLCTFPQQGSSLNNQIEIRAMIKRTNYSRSHIVFNITTNDWFVLRDTMIFILVIKTAPEIFCKKDKACYDIETYFKLGWKPSWVLSTIERERTVKRNWYNLISKQTKLRHWKEGNGRKLSMGLEYRVPPFSATFLCSQQNLVLSPNNSFFR